MTILEASKAYESLQNVMQLCHLTGGTVLKIVRLSHRLRDAFETLRNRQDCIINTYADKDESGNALYNSDRNVMVSDAKKRKEAQEKLDALCAEPFDAGGIEKITVTLPDVSVPISPQDVVNLSLFIEFGGAHGNV